jgi:hypothetical protein
MNLKDHHDGKRDSLPAPTGWPMTAAFGFTLVLAGLITHPLVSVSWGGHSGYGTGWLVPRCAPQEAHETVPVERETGMLLIPGREVRHLQIGEQGHRARLPLEVYPYSAGIRGGLVGGAAMALLAVLYGLIGHKSIWYPINLLAAAGSAKLSAMSYQQLLAFSDTGLLLASIIHIAASTLVGLLIAFASIFPRRPILMGGIVAPRLVRPALHSARHHQSGVERPH